MRISLLKITIFYLITMNNSSLIFIASTGVVAIKFNLYLYMLAYYLRPSLVFHSPLPHTSKMLSESHSPPSIFLPYFLLCSAWIFFSFQLLAHITYIIYSFLYCYPQIQYKESTGDSSSIFWAFSILCAKCLKLYFAYSGNALNIFCNNEFLCIFSMNSTIIFYIIKELSNYQNWTMLHSIFVHLFA